MKYYIAIDIGASSGRHILGSVEDGELKTEEIYRFKNGAKARDGSLVWDIDELFKEVINGLKRAKELGKVPEIIGIDTWAVDYALLDKDDELIGGIYCYRDGRTAEAVKAVHRAISFDELYNRTGVQYQPFNTIYQLYADKLSGRLEQAECMLLLPDYLNFLLTGEKRWEYTNATTTGLVNARTGDWDGDILEITGLPRKLFGKISSPATVVGKLRREIAEQVGYDAVIGLPATHDTASAVEGIPFEGDAPYISSGTWSLLGVKVGEAMTDENSRRANYTNEGGVGYFRYQKNVMGMWVVNRLRDELCPETGFPEIVELAKKSEFENTVDINASAFLSPASMKEAFEEALGLAPKSVGDYFRCAYLSLAKSYKTALDELESNVGKTYGELYIVGGGAKNAFLNGLVEKATGKRVIALPIEASAAGNLKILKRINI